MASSTLCLYSESFCVQNAVGNSKKKMEVCLGFVTLCQAMCRCDICDLAEGQSCGYRALMISRSTWTSSDKHTDPRAATDMPCINLDLRGKTSTVLCAIFKPFSIYEIGFHIAHDFFLGLFVSKITRY